MGDRISIQFSYSGNKSVALFSHYDGLSFYEKAKAYVKTLKLEASKGGGFPLYRLEPETVMVDFIRHLTESKIRVTGNYYLGATDNDGDNSDNGNFVIALDEKPARKDSREVEFFYKKSYESPKLRRLSVTNESAHTIAGIDLDCNEYRCFLKSRILNGKIFEPCANL